jgi:hypothetical protein
MTKCNGNESNERNNNNNSNSNENIVIMKIINIMVSVLATTP